MNYNFVNSAYYAGKSENSIFILKQKGRKDIHRFFPNKICHVGWQPMFIPIQFFVLSYS